MAEKKEEKTKVAPKEEAKPTEEKKETPKVKAKEETKEEMKKEEKPEAKKEEVKLNETQKKIVEMIEKMSVLELADLVKALEDKFGVTAAAMAPVAAPAGVTPAEGEQEEKSTFDVILTSGGDNKIAVIKAVRTVIDLGLKEAKDLVEAAPKPVKEGVKKEEAENIKKTLEEAGASVELK